MRYKIMLVGDILRRNARIYRKKVALIDGDKSFDYEEVNRRTNQLANALRLLGLKKQDRVAVMANNCHQLAEVCFAVAKAGFVVVPVNTRLSAEEVRYIINHSDSIALIYQADFKEIIEKIEGSIPNVNYLISIGGAVNETHRYEPLIMSASDNEPEEEISPDELSMIMYTSGATGIPKGVLITHHNIMANNNTMTHELRIVPEDINLLVMPIYHIGGFWPLMTHFYRGSTTILLPHFDVDRLLEIIEKEKVTFLNLVPTTLIRLVSHPHISNYNLESLRLIMYASAPIAMTKLKKAMKILGPHRFYTGLGATEASGSLISFPTTEHALEGPLSEKLGTVGRDSIGVEIRIVDDSGAELPLGEVGEIIAKGENIARGYLKMPKETAETFRGDWLYTGDLGFRDEGGYIFITDRKKDIIISGGENISSQEVEQVIYQSPYVEEVAAIGVPDEEWGEAVKVVIKLKPDYKGKITEGDVIEFCKGKLAGFKKPKSVEFVDELPKNPVGKILKKELVERYGNK
ncbi:long-chain-fatty-acid--CoA ligase [Thermodesulfobacteriota bacterium]